MRDAKATAVAIFLLTPRSPIAYPFYITTAIACVAWRRAAPTAWIALLTITFMAVMPQALTPDPYIANTILGLALAAPTLLWLCGFRTWLAARSVYKALTALNIGAFGLSLYTLVSNGFPQKIPYLSMSPDYYQALYGFGGARIVTLIGFFGLYACIWARQSNAPAPAVTWVISALNFLAPSYILGIICGLVALGFPALRSIRSRLALGAITAPALYYALVTRLPALDPTLSTLGHSPKRLAYELSLKAIDDTPTTLMIGNGIGQFSSTPQLWASEGLRSISLSAVPDGIGIEQTGRAYELLEPLFRLSLTSPYAISSSANKPYTGFSTVLAELGVVGAALVGILIVRRLLDAATLSSSGMSPALFFILLNSVDHWIDNLWLGALLLLATGLLPRAPLPTELDRPDDLSALQYKKAPTPSAPLRAGRRVVVTDKRHGLRGL